MYVGRGLLQSLLLLFPPLNEMTQLLHCSRKNKSTRTPHVIFVCLEDVSVSIYGILQVIILQDYIAFYYIHSKLGGISSLLYSMALFGAKSQSMEHRNTTQLI